MLIKLPWYILRRCHSKKPAFSWKKKALNFISFLIASHMLFRNLQLPGLLNKNFKSCSKTFDITEFLLTSFQQLTTFVSGGDLSLCFRLLKVIKVMTLFALLLLKVTGRVILFPLILLFLFCGALANGKKKEMHPTGPLSWKHISLEIILSNTEEVISQFTFEKTLSPS